MDLRNYIKNQQQLNNGINFVERGILSYQPFILSDDIEVGEGLNFVENYANVETVNDLNVCAPDFVKTIGKKATDPIYFRQSNAEYRSIYNHYADVICKQFNNDISNISFAEIGCNTGLNLFNLATRGARSCIGYDWNNMKPLFSWLNEVLGTKVKFKHGLYNNLFHHFSSPIPEVDVMLVPRQHKLDKLNAKVKVIKWAHSRRGECYEREYGISEGIGRCTGKEYQAPYAA